MTPMNPQAGAAMNIQVSGRHVDVGEALRTRIVNELEAVIGKVFDRGGSGEVVVSRDGHSFCVDAVILLASGQQLVVRALGGDAHTAFDAALAKLESRLRRYKTRLKNHHPHLGGIGGLRVLLVGERAGVYPECGDRGERRAAHPCASWR